MPAVLGAGAESFESLERCLGRNVFSQHDG